MCFMCMFSVVLKKSKPSYKKGDLSFLTTKSILHFTHTDMLLEPFYTIPFPKLERMKPFKTWKNAHALKPTQTQQTLTQHQMYVVVVLV